jgi:hypothetical protein
MIRYTTKILQFQEMGEKTGWTYIEIPADLAEQLKPDNKKSFRVKGKLDKYAIKGVALMPMGGGLFIMALKAEIRKGIAKKVGAMLDVQLSVDDNPTPVNSPELLACLKDDPEAEAFFNSLPQGHRNYFMNWVESAKTTPTKDKRIAQAVTALSRKWGYGEMIRANKEPK